MFAENQALRQGWSVLFKLSHLPFLFGMFLMHCYPIYTSVGRIYSGASALYKMHVLSSSAILLICQVYYPVFPGCY